MCNVGDQQISHCCCETGIQVNFTYKPADSQCAIDPKSCLLLANLEARKGMMNKGCILKCYINTQVLVEMYYMHGCHCRHFWDKASLK